jgi:hypothetical protein
MPKAELHAQNNIPHTNWGFLSATPFIQNMIFSRNKCFGNKLIKEGHVWKIILEQCKSRVPKSGDLGI